MALVPGPPLGMASRSFVDPRADADPDSCERDYSVPCPAGFVNVGAVKGADEEYCAASPEYDGPCSSEGHKLAKMSSKARARWSRMCEANWPCKTCERDYGDVCPSGWSMVPGRRSARPRPTMTARARGLQISRSTTWPCSSDGARSARCTGSAAGRSEAHCRSPQEHADLLAASAAVGLSRH